MSRLRSVLFLGLLLSGSTAAGDHSGRFSTRSEITRDLFAQDNPGDDLSSPNFRLQELVTTKKSVGLAVLYSLLVPGLGEYYAGDYSLGKFLSAAEAGLWVTYFTFDVYGSSLRDDARSFAAAHAGINPVGKNDQFYVDIGNFYNAFEFNDKRLRERSPERLYDVHAGEGWQWDSDANRAQYREHRISADNVLNNRKFVVTAIVINHVISAINAARTAIAHNKDVNDQVGALQFKASVMGGLGNAHGVMLTVSRQF